MYNLDSYFLLPNQNIIIEEMILIKNFLFSCLKKCFPWIIANWDRIKIAILCNTIYRNQDIRLSIAYLIRININNKYLLVKSKRIPNQFQPVGGVYKYYDGAVGLFDELGVQPDDGYKFDKDLHEDLRIKVKGKHVLKIIKWFESQKSRETSPHREFIEELIDTKILSSPKVFNIIKTSFIKRTICPLKFSDKFQCNEILIRDIYKFTPTDKQIKALELIFDKETDDFRWFEPEEIKRRGRTLDRRELVVGEHTLDIL